MKFGNSGGGSFGDDPTDEENKKRFKIDPSSVPTYRPSGERGGQARSDEMSLKNAQRYLNDHFPHTVSNPTPAEVAERNKLAEGLGRVERGEIVGSEADKFTNAYRERMAEYQGQLDSLRDHGYAPKDGKDFIAVNVDNPREYDAWERGQGKVEAVVMERYRKEGMAFQEVAENRSMTLPSDKLAKSGDKATVTTWTADGTALKNSYRMDGDRVIHTRPNGEEQSMTLAESRVVQADHAAAVNRNTASAVEKMKNDPNLSYQQGDFSYSVRGDQIVRKDAQGKEAFMPVAAFEANLANRKERCEAAQHEARAQLTMENKTRPATEEKATDLKSATARFEAKMEAIEDGKAFNGQKTVVERLREKEAEKGQGATLKNPNNGDTYRLSEDGKNLHCTDKNGKEKPTVEAEKAHADQARWNAATVADKDKEKERAR